MSNLFNSFNAETQYSDIDFNRADYQQGTTFADLRSNGANSFNRKFEMELADGLPLGNFDGIGVYNQQRNEGEDATVIRLLQGNRIAADTLNKTFGQTFLKADQLLEYSMQKGSLQNILNGQELPGMPFVQMDINNGDQYRMFGRLMVNAVPNSGIKLAISQFSIDAYRVASGNNVATSIPVPANYANVPVSITFSPKYAPYLVNGATSCQPFTGDCAQGFRKVTIIKPRKSGEIVNGTLVAGSYNSESDDRVMHGYVVDTEFNVDGSYTLVILEGITRSSSTGSPTVFDKNLPFAIEAGDYLEFGNVDVATECVPTDSCTKASPRIYSYCSTAKEVTDCIYKDNKNERYYQNQNELTYTERAKYEAYQNLRDFYLRFGNMVLEDRPNYAQGKRLPIAVPGSNPTTYDYTENTVIPNGTRGILPMIEDFGWTIYHTFTSNYDTTGQFVLERLLEDKINTLQAARVFNDRGWIITGEIKNLRSIANDHRPYENVIPNQFGEAMDLERMKALSFDKNAKSIFGSYYDAKETNGGEIDRFVIGNGKSIPSMHDESIARKHPDTIYFMNDNANICFGPNIDGIEKKFMGQNFYFPETGQTGKLAPYIYSQDLVPTMANGKVDFRTQNNCHLQFNAYMFYGIFTKAEYVPHQGRIKMAVKQPNPEFNPAVAESANNPRYIFSSTKTLGNVYNTAERAIRDSRAGTEYNA